MADPNYYSGPTFDNQPDTQQQSVAPQNDLNGYLLALWNQVKNEPGGADMYEQLKNQLAAQYQGKMGTDQSGNYYKRDPQGNVWLTTPGSPSGYAYGAATPTPGIDQRAWTNVADPNAFQYGGAPGAAQSEETRYAQMGNLAGNAAAPRINMAGYNAAIGGAQQDAQSQQQLVQQLQQQASGQGPSLADAQTQAALQNAYRQQATIAGSARGGGANLAAAQGQAAQAAMGLQSAALQGAAQGRIQEQLGAEQALGGLTSQMRAQQLQQAQMAGGLAQQQAQFQFGQNQLNQQGQLAYEAMRQGVFNSQMGGQMAGEAQNAQTGLSQQQLAWQQQNAANQWQHQLIGAGLMAGGAIIGGPAGAAGGAAAAGAINGASTSDVRAKENVRPAGNQIDDALAKMGAYQYEYNRPDLPPGTQTGTMAQQLAQTPAGAPVVGKDPYSGQLFIQGPQAQNFSLAALARLNERLAAIEKSQGVEPAPTQAKAIWGADARAQQRDVPAAPSPAQRQIPGTNYVYPESYYQPTNEGNWVEGPQIAQDRLNRETASQFLNRWAPEKKGDEHAER